MNYAANTLDLICFERIPPRRFTSFATVVVGNNGLFFNTLLLFLIR